ncbi:hypothetical protein JOD69_003684 [Methylocaldum sp. RMAD-M]|jgi:hypothetical protein|nr:hypothetical protein [Methylocaldum sp. RMAD-M]
MRGSKRKFLHFIPLTLSLREREPKALLRKSCRIKGEVPNRFAG